jgi:hypothetical protein
MIRPHKWLIRPSPGIESSFECLSIGTSLAKPGRRASADVTAIGATNDHSLAAVLDGPIGGRLKTQWSRGWDQTLIGLDILGGSDVDQSRRSGQTNKAAELWNGDFY